MTSRIFYEQENDFHLSDVVIFSKLTLKVLSKIVKHNILFLIITISEKIRLSMSPELSASSCFSYRMPLISIQHYKQDHR